MKHMLIEMWDRVLDMMEGGKTSVALLWVDYEKAFNRMDYAACINQLRALGASDGSILSCQVIPGRE